MPPDPNGPPCHSPVSLLKSSLSHSVILAHDQVYRYTAWQSTSSMMQRLKRCLSMDCRRSQPHQGNTHGKTILSIGSVDDTCDPKTGMSRNTNDNRATCHVDECLCQAFRCVPIMYQGRPRTLDAPCTANFLTVLLRIFSSHNDRGTFDCQFVRRSSCGRLCHIRRFTPNVKVNSSSLTF